jgi:hypothetical protein
MLALKQFMALLMVLKTAMSGKGSAVTRQCFPSDSKRVISALE